MNIRIGAMTLLLMVSSLFCSAQDKTFRHIVGRDINSSDVRAQVRARQRLGVPQLLAKVDLRSQLPAGTDWAVSVGLPPMGFNQWPMTWPYTSTSPSCSDYAVFPTTGTPAVGGQANLVILNNLYRGAGPGVCGTGAATVQAAYAVGTTGSLGAPTASFKGASKGLKIGLVEHNTAVLHLITVGTGGTVANAVAPTETTIDYTNITNAHCTAGTVHTANHSDFWVDYATDEGYASDDAGKIYHFTGVFNGTPTMDFCTTINGGAWAGLPEHVNFAGTDYIFFISNGKRLYRAQVNATRTAFTGATNLILDSGTNNIVDDILIDIDIPAAYVWTSRNASGAQASEYQITGLAGGTLTIAAELRLGPAITTPGGVVGAYLMGEMDDVYWSGTNFAGATGYTCVYPNGSAGAPRLASYTFNASGTIAGYTAMSDTNGNNNINPGSGTTTGNVCTDVIEVHDVTAGVDQLFVATGNGNQANANRLSRWDITSPITNVLATPTANVVNIYGGSSRIVIDNVDSGLGLQTQNLYFGDLSPSTVTSKCGGTAPNTNACAIKLQQAGLN